MVNLSQLNFMPTEDQVELISVVEDLGRGLRDYETECYLAGKFNDKLAPHFAQGQMLGLPISDQYGDGQGADMVTYAMALEKIGEEGCSVRTFFSGHISIGQLVLQQWANDEQKERYLHDTTKGEKIMAFGLTEPGAGSNPAGLATTFEEKDGGYVLNGRKSWISNGTIADVVTIYAYPKGKVGNKKEMCAFIVDSDSEGYSSALHKHKMGLATSDTGMLFFDDCVVPKENLLGPRGKGLSIAYATLMNGRLSVAAGCVGVMQDCLNEARDYARQRVQHGKEIGKHQLVQRHIGLMSTNLEAGRLLVLKAAWMKQAYNDDPTPVKREAADQAITQAKYFSTNASFDAADRAVQIFGANGYSFENRPARHLCDTRVCRIYEGANEILEQKMAVFELGAEYAAYS